MEGKASMKKLLITLGLLMVLSMPAVFAKDIYMPNQWGQYGGYAHLVTTGTPEFYSFHNARFKIHTLVPSCVTKVYLPANGDGAIFENDNGSVKFRVSGSYNTPGTTVEDLLDRTVKSLGPATILLAAPGNDFYWSWYIVSAVKDGTAIYIEGVVMGNTYGNMEFRYPVKDRNSYDWMLQKFRDSFSIGL